MSLGKESFSKSKKAYLGKQSFEFGEAKFLKLKKIHFAYLGNQYLYFGEGKFLKLKRSSI